ncbi:MAG: hypothetical protein IJX14_11290 [Clostridia bacterium]|nr:hypothetical protein [Clostridia bacterium]
MENIRLPHTPGVSQDDAALAEAAVQIRKQIGVKPLVLHINKKSIDARRKPRISFVYSVYAEIEAAPGGMEKLEAASIKRCAGAELPIPCGTEALAHRPVIIGFGPAGMFCGLLLAKCGLRPLILERGSDVAGRTKKVDHFNRTGELDLCSNIQFGAGGAGTFSDGKLTTRIHDPMIANVLQTLTEMGAPEDILWKAKPHIGTDILVQVVENTDREIRRLGGEIRYDCPVTHIADQYVIADGEKIPCGVVILATGHSARDLYADLLASAYTIVPKPFSVGVRAEHLQSWLNEAMFGALAGDPTLGEAEYQLSHRQGERGCYTFCMCPGGEVVAAASEEGGVVTNGMSRHARNGRNANAAVCVSVQPGDYGNTPADAIGFQRELEQKAFAAGGRNYYAPMQTVGDFLNGTKGTMPGKIRPTYRDGMVTPVDFHDLFPGFVTEMLTAGLTRFDRQIKGYAAPHVPLTGIETRTSAPVRILRTEALTAPGHDTVYPCGEGAGYAGGIVSAAVDGLRVALQILGRYRHP